MISIVGFGVLAPILNLGVKWSYPDVFSKKGSKQKQATQELKSSGKSDFLRNEQQPVVQEKSPVQAPD